MHDDGMARVTPTLDQVHWPVHTQRLSLRLAEPGDLDATWRYRRLPAVTTWLTTSTTERSVYDAKFLDLERLSRSLVIQRGGEVIGDLMLRVKDAWAQSEVEGQARGVE